MAEPKFTQFFIKFLDNKTLTLQFPNDQTLTPQSIKQKIQTLTNTPIESHQTLTLTLNGKLLTNTTQITLKSLSLSTLHLNLPLHGGKGGFGSLLRGAATKAGQKKTNNFDACRDMSGRRLRHVNAEKKLEEWKAGEEERKLEKMAEEYLKKMEKKGKGGKRDESAEKYVEKYREDSRKCVEEVERSVRECFGGVKRKKGVEIGGGDAKKLKIWMGKRKMGESDSDDSDTESDSDEENEKSVVTENGNQSDSSKDISCASDPVDLLNGDNHSGRSSDSGSEEEKEAVARGTPELATSSSGSHVHLDGHVDIPVGEKIVIEQDRDENHCSATAVSDQLPADTSVEPDAPQVASDVPELNGASECKSVSSDGGVTGSLTSSEFLKPLNFGDFNLAAELEVLGMERLKSELQERGLKCGGTLQERAARLFLLKTTPLDKLPKKLLAKK